MSRRNKKFLKEEQYKKYLDRQTFWEKSKLHPEVQKSIWALVFLAITIFTVLAGINQAGPIGNSFYSLLEKILGWGYFLMPIILLSLSLMFLISERNTIYQISFLGAILFLLSGLGLIDIFMPGRGGWLGDLIGSLEQPFGYIAASVFLLIALIIAFLIIFNIPLKIKRSQEFDDKDISLLAKKDSLENIENENEKKNKKVIKEEAQDQDDERENLEPLDLVMPQNVYSKTKVNVVNRSKSLAISLGQKYTPPPLSLLKSAVEKPTAGDLRANANIIKRTLESFGISVEMGEINIGPKVTRYTLKPAEGVKLSRITALNQDLALALASHPIRIEAPIPGKSLVGIEVPNKASAVVRLGSLMGYPEFASSGSLSFVLGRDVAGEPIFADIDRAPHFLIAGSTGSGKSIMIHALLISLLYKNSPETLRLILIDPKRVELSLYNNLPHLITPVITDPKKAVGVFRWAINEMDRRYEFLMHAGSRDIQSYNKKHPQKMLPYILIVIDELADLMATYGREIEGAIVRLAQMARATGIHLVLSTQRPSVEVVTGLIKANITARIALQLPSQVDSRTVLDVAGAEKLLGGGDMLFISSDLSKPKRIQGAYISEEEVQKVTDFIKENNKNFINDEELFFDNASTNLAVSEVDLTQLADNEEDSLLEEAIQVVREAKKASASLLQRRLKVGYARAARLLDIMEEKGIVGPADGAKPREVYLASEDRINDSSSLE